MNQYWLIKSLNSLLIDYRYSFTDYCEHLLGIITESGEIVSTGHQLIIVK